MSQSQHFIHPMDNKKKAPAGLAILVIVLAIVLGGATGYFGSKVMAGTGVGPGASSTDSVEEKDASGSITKAGVKNTKEFKDTAEGTLREGGFEGEGSFHLERPGGESQNVYLTSSTVDLSQFVGKKVSVLGKTFEAEKAGWLMDVGYIEVK